MLRKQTVSGTARWGIAILAFLCAGSPSQGATISTTFTVTATVLASCSVSAADLDFGIYAPGSGSDTTASSTIDVTCSNGATYTIKLDGGSVANDMTAREMSDGSSHTLSYGLYTDASCTTIWGDGTGSTATVGGTGNGSPQSVTVYGKVPAGQYATPATYTDHISVTVTY
ncbi:MAG TPA: spore coat U domain-containing protein [Rhizomicrobium sp.]|nr:spore coat U domain-containing protein [Rhizomicrobium sp.]